MSEKRIRIGHTPLVKLNGADFVRLSAYLKDESFNIYGTAKDRRSQFIVQEALRLGVDKLVLITAGNNGYSLAKIASGDIKVATIIDKQMSENVKKALQKVAYQVIEVNLQHKILRPEEVIAFSREREDEVIWDVTNGYEESYMSIVSELRELNPNYIVVPIGSGGIYVGIIEGIGRYNLTTKVIGIGVQNTTSSFADKLHTPWTPYAKVMAKYHKLGHTIYRLTEPEIKQVWQKYQHISNLEPSSVAVFAALNLHKFEDEETVVFLNTGKLLVD